jgi:chemotaxis protein methyltransferase CheR
MLTHRALAEALPEWRVEILGTDISPCALDVARRGVYRRFSLPAIELDLKHRYFSEQGGLFHVGPEARSMVTFRRHNLRDHLGARRLGRWDAIFCRDSLVWFDDETRADVLATLHDQLADDGFLFLGPTERVRDEPVPFVGLDVRAAGVYLKHRGAQGVGS